MIVDRLPAVRLPGAERRPLVSLGRRVALACALILLIALIAYLDRDGYRDVNDDPISFIDALYYSTVTITTTGYGDITPVTEGARLLTTFLVTPLRVVFLILLVGTTLEFLTTSTVAAVREKRWRRKLRDHTIICGFGTTGMAAAETLLSRGTAADDIVVIDARQEAAEAAVRAGFAGVTGNATHDSTLTQAGIGEASALVVAVDRDDTAVLVVLSARQRAPKATIVVAVRNEENARLVRDGGADAVVVTASAAGRLLGVATATPEAVGLLEDLISVGDGLDLLERRVREDEVGGPPGDRHGVCLAVIRGDDVIRYDDPRAESLQAGDRVISVQSNT